MGYLFMAGNCFICNIPFAFNPARVPSIRDSEGRRQPVCKGCVDRANAMRKQNGMEPFWVPPDAYSVCSEAEF